MFPMATASTPALPRVLREATSQVRDLLLWSVQEIWRRATHFVSEVDTSVMLWMVPFWAFMLRVVVVKVRLQRVVGLTRVRRVRVAVRFSIGSGRFVDWLGTRASTYGWLALYCYDVFD